MGSEEVLIAVDPHKGHNTLVVLDAVSRRAVEEAEFANTHAGYREMVRFARRWRAAPLGRRRMSRGRAFPGPTPGGRGRGGLRRAGQTGRPGAGVLPGPWPQDRP